MLTETQWQQYEHKTARAGLIVRNGRVTVTAPILRYMHGWMLARVEEYAQAAGWTVERIGG